MAAIRRRMRARTWLLGPLVISALLGACSSGSKTTASTAATVNAAPPQSAGNLNQILEGAWAAGNIAKTASVDDATFLRRVSLDVLGVLPSPEKVAAFTNEKGPQKRAALVDEFLKDPRFSDRFATVWTDYLLSEGKMKDGVDKAAFRAFLKARMDARTPWDKIAHEVISAEGRNSPGGKAKERGIAAMSKTAESEAEGVHGAVNFPLRYRNMVEDLAGKTSRAFLGIQIQCAQCHDHKTEKWTTAQFRGFAAAFIKTRAVQAEEREKGSMRLFDVKDVERAKLGPKAPDSAKTIATVAPAALDGTALNAKDPRKALADWITKKDNPTFAKAFVNRMWATYLGSGFVEPVDDFRPGNPVRLPAALDLLSKDFVESGFDVRGLIRAIVLSAAYDRSAGGTKELWASFQLRPLGAGVLLDAVVSATGLEKVVEEVAGDRADLLRAKVRQRFLLVLDVDEDAGSQHFEGSIAHALLMANGAVTQAGSRVIAGGALETILSAPGNDESKVTALYIRTLSRPPEASEMAVGLAFLAEAGKSKAARAKGNAPAAAGKDPLGKLSKRLRSGAKTAKDEAYEDLLWALLNSSEMAFQH